MATVNKGNRKAKHSCTEAVQKGQAQSPQHMISNYRQSGLSKELANQIGVLVRQDDQDDIDNVLRKA